jgi:hypothetical protein
MQNRIAWPFPAENRKEELMKWLVVVILALILL